MGWVSRSEPALVDAIVGSFSESREQASRRLARFSPQDWARTEYWLDTSGLALYFLDLVRSRRLTDAVDAGILAKLQDKLLDNKLRVAEMLRELTSINASFQSAGISYANLKGFTLAPDSCPDVCLRHQSDFDFLVDPHDLDVSRALLEAHGYKLTAFGPCSLEFKTQGPIRVSLDGQYKAGNRRSAELHVGLDRLSAMDPKSGRDPRLDRLSSWEYGAGCLPSLAPADQLIGQALHILAHLRNEHTRPSWLLEYRRHVQRRQADIQFWHMVQNLASGQPEIAVAFGLSTLLATELFGPFSPPELNVWTVYALPAKVRLWAERYGRRAVLADVPGTKFYLLLEGALREKRPKALHHSLRHLIPLRRPDRILHGAYRAPLRQRIWQEIVELQFLLFRLRFHLEQGFRFVLEARRWRRLCAAFDEAEQMSTACSCDLHQE